MKEECDHEELIWEFNGWAKCAICGKIIKIKEK